MGPFVYCEVVLWDEDDPSICNDNDNLGVFTWIEYIHEDGWAPKTLNDISSREGCVEVTVEITDE